MKKGPQSDWAQWNCIPQEGSAVPSSKELGSLLGTPLLYALTTFYFLSVLAMLTEVEPQTKTQALNVPLKTGRVSQSSELENSSQKAGVLLCSPKPQVFPKTKSLALKNNPKLWILHSEPDSHCPTKSSLWSQHFEDSRLVCSKHYQDNKPTTLPPCMGSEGRWQLSILISGSFQTLPSIWRYSAV